MWRTNAGGVGNALTAVSASWRVRVTSLFASPVKPMCVSLIWTKLKSPPADASPAWASVRDESTPPAEVQTTPVPTHAMHSRNPLRSIARSSV